MTRRPRRRLKPAGVSRRGLLGFVLPLSFSFRSWYPAWPEPAISRTQLEPWHPRKPSHRARRALGRLSFVAAKRWIASEQWRLLISAKRIGWLSNNSTCQSSGGTAYL
jgi:hypothetical protein